MTIVLDAIEKYASEKPNEIAIKSANGSMSYCQLNTSINSVAIKLRSQNITLLALYADNCPFWVVIDLACQKLEICLLPIPTFFSEQQIAHALTNSGADALISPFQLCSGATEKTPSLKLEDGLKFYSLTVDKTAEIPIKTSKITYTSGSTGSPKGVCLSSAQMMDVAQSIVKASPTEQIKKHLCTLPLAVLLENIGGVYANLLLGSEIILLPVKQIGFTGSSQFDAEKFLHTITMYQPNSLILLPQLLDSLLRVHEYTGLKASVKTALNCLKFIAVGGGKVTPSNLKLAEQIGLAVFEGYGLSECASVVCLNTIENRKIATVGRYLPHISAEISDEGELIIFGSTFLGYLNDPASWYPTSLATGDLCKIDDDGYISIYGRKKNLLISSFGRNISPEWVESTILQAPSINQCFVFGDAEPYCVALIATDNVQDAARQLEEYNQQLPDYAQIKHWYKLEKNLTYEDNFFTENGRPKRQFIAEAYNCEINALYQTETMNQKQTKETYAIF